MNSTSSDDESDRMGETAENIRKLAQGLIHETDSREHRFRSSWVDQLLERYRQRPGSPIVHLRDFTGHAQLHLKPDARQIVQPYWDQLVSRDGRWAWKHFRSVVNYLKGGLGTPRLKQWKHFGSLTGFDLNSLEPHVESIRLADGSHIRLLNNPRLPVNLATSAGARLIGYYFDSNRRDGSFTNKDLDLHADYRKAVREVFGDLTTSESVMIGGGFGVGPYTRTRVGPILLRALTVAGFDCAQDQTPANNALPSWLFTTTNIVKSECVSAFWDAEGSVNYHDVKASQAVRVEVYPDEAFPTWPERKALRKLTLDNQERVLEQPPLVLVSTALLLYSMGMVSRLEPRELTLSHGIPTAHWQLRIHRVASIQAFQAQIKLRSVAKQFKLINKAL